MRHNVILNQFFYSRKATRVFGYHSCGQRSYFNDHLIIVNPRRDGSSVVISDRQHAGISNSDMFVKCSDVQYCNRFWFSYIISLSFSTRNFKELFKWKTQDQECRLGSWWLDVTKLMPWRLSTKPSWAKWLPILLNFIMLICWKKGDILIVKFNVGEFFQNEKKKTLRDTFLQIFTFYLFWCRIRFKGQYHQTLVTWQTVVTENPGYFLL